MQKFFTIALYHTRHRNTRPLGYYFGDIFAVYLFFEKRVLSGLFAYLALIFIEATLGFYDLSISYLRYLAVVARFFRLLRFELQAVDVLLLLLDPVNNFFLTF